MKSIFTIFAALAMLALGLASCENPVDNGQNPPELPRLTIKNESSYVLTEVKFSGLSFAAANSAELPPTSQSVKQLSQDDLNKAGYISFVRKDIGIICRTDAVLTLSDTDETFTFTDNIVVVEQGNTENRKSLAQITFVSKITIEQSGRDVSKNDVINLGEVLANNTTKSFDFTLKNTTSGKLLLTGNEPVKAGGEDGGSFTVVQPSRSEIAPDDSLPFKINFRTMETRNHSATVTIKSNDADGDFSFEINVSGVAPKPIVSIYLGESEILQDGVIDAGGTLINQPKIITVIIKNTGAGVLTIDTANIVISGTDAAAFTKTNNPGTSIQPDSQTSFIITANPTRAGENTAMLIIPTNDNSRNPVNVYLKINAGKVTRPAKPALYAGDRSIKLVWGKIDDADSYKVYYSTSAVPPGTAGFTTTDTSTVITGLTNGTAYYVWVQAVKGASHSDLSEYAQGTPTTNFTVNTTTTFENAITNINNAVDGSYTITVTGNFTASTVRFIGGANKTITIQGDSGRRTVSNDGSSALFVAPGGITLELGDNLTLNGNAKEASLVEVQAAGTFVMLTGSSLSGAGKPAVTSSGSFTMKGGSISNNIATSSEGGGVLITGGTFTMEAGTISGNGAVTYGGGVYVSAGSFIMEGGTISANTLSGTSSEGGGVYVGSSGYFKKTGGTIDGANSAANGKAVYTGKGYYRNAAAGVSHDMDSNIAGSGGGWGDPTTRLSIKNQSAYDLADVQWQDTVFTDTAGNTLAKNDTITKSVDNGSAYLYFTRKTDPVNTRTKDPVSVSQYADTEFTITDDTAVVEAGNAGNNGTLKDLVSTANFMAASRADFDSAVAGINGMGEGEYTIDVSGDFTIAEIRFTGTAVKTINIAGGSSTPTLSNSGSNELFVVRTGLTLKLANITLNGNKKAARVIKVEEGGTLIMNSGATVSGAATYGIHCEGAFTMNAGTVSNNSNSLTASNNISNYCGGVLVAGGVFTMNGGNITGNSVSSSSSSFSSISSYTYGGGVYVSGGVFTMKGGSITGNSVSSSSSSSHYSPYSYYAYAYAYGGGVCVNGGTFTMSGGSITGNSVSVSSYSSSYSSYYSCSYAYGGGVYVNNGEFTKTGGSIDTANTLSTVGNFKYSYGVVAYTVSGSDGFYRSNTTGAAVNMDSRELTSSNYTGKGWETCRTHD